MVTSRRNQEHRGLRRDTGAARDFSELFTRIVNLAPAPIGLGPALSRT